MVRCIVSLMVLAACTPFSRPSEPPPNPRPLPGLVKGANLRPVGDERRGYGSSTARRTMRRLKALGVNTIGVMMEGRMRNLEDLSVEVASRDELEPTRQALLDAHALGFATVLIPHIYLDDGSWRGHLRFASRAESDRWWRSYEQFMLTAAEVATAGGASVLSIGVELKALSGLSETETRMSALASRIRQEFEGALTYSANWDEAEDVSFWHVVDLIGVNAYYPLRPDPIRGAEKVAEQLSALAEKAARPVVILEVGYRSSPLPHVRPWEWPQDVNALVDQEAQARVWAAALSNWLGAAGIQGLLVWVIPTDPDDPASEPAHGFNPLNKRAEAVIARAFGGVVQHAAE